MLGVPHVSETKLQLKNHLATYTSAPGEGGSCHACAFRCRPSRGCWLYGAFVSLVLSATYSDMMERSVAAGVAGIEGAELAEIRWKPCVLVWPFVLWNGGVWRQRKCLYLMVLVWLASALER